MSEAESVTLYLGDCLDILRQMPDNSIDALVTDPPAGIGFMGKEWDHDKGGRDAWVAWLSGVMSECLRVLKPGAHALVWALPRTSHWTGWALEEAGFEVRDRIAHLFGSGFPKSLDVSKAIDKMAGAEREVVGTYKQPDMANRKNGSGPRHKEQVGEFGYSGSLDVTAPATPAAVQWQGWGTALKPACEDWWLCRKPLAEGTVAANVLEWGTGAINVDGCRIGTERPATNPDPMKFKRWKEQDGNGRAPSNNPDTDTGKGRFPANVTHDGSEEVLAGFPNAATGGRALGGIKQGLRGNHFQAKCHNPIQPSSGSAARFFYCAKASRQDREEGCEGLDVIIAKRTQAGGDDTRGRPTPINANHHPTVKPTPLMRWLCRLITPPGGTVLDPFMGSGSTGKAAALEGFGFVGIELDPEYYEIAKRRIEAVQHQPQMVMEL